MTCLVCVGHSTIDTIYRVAAIPSTPTKVLANAYAEAGGGMAANASIAAARLGGIVHYWGRVGDDALGKRIVALLESEGVQTTAVRRIEGARSPCTAVLVDDRGERLICIYNDPALDADAAWLPVLARRRRRGVGRPTLAFGCGPRLGGRACGGRSNNTRWRRRSRDNAARLVQVLRLRNLLSARFKSRERRCSGGRWVAQDAGDRRRDGRRDARCRRFPLARPDTSGGRGRRVWLPSTRLRLATSSMPRSHWRSANDARSPMPPP